MPSGRLLSDLRRPGGSRIAGMWTERRAHLTISLSAVCRENRPALLRQERPCCPDLSTSDPHTQVWGSQSCRPSLLPIEFLSWASVNLRPKFMQGRVDSHAAAVFPWNDVILRFLGSSSLLMSASRDAS